MHRLRPVSLKVKNIGRHGRKTTISIPLRVDPRRPLQNSTLENSTDIENPSEDQNLPLDDLDQPSSTQQQNRILIVCDNSEKVREKLLSSCIELILSNFLRM